MTNINIEVRGDFSGLVGKAGHAKARAAHWRAIRLGIVEVERLHKKRYLRPGGGQVRPKAADRNVIMIRHGTLKKSLTRRLDEANLTAGYGSDHKPMLWIDEGTRPYTITPKSKNLLRFKINGKWISKHWVDHPGIWPRQTLKRVGDDIAPQLERMVVAELDKAGL